MANETIRDMRDAYKSLRVGRSMHCEHAGGEHRVIGVGRRWIRLLGGKQIEAKDVIDWWTA